MRSTTLFLTTMALACLSLLFSCSKVSAPLAMKSVGIHEVGAYSATCCVEATPKDDNEIVKRGICWSRKTEPTICDSVVYNNNKIGSYECRIVGLRPNTKYHVRAFVMADDAVTYGKEATFTTRAPYRISILGDSYSTFEGHLTPDTNLSWYPYAPSDCNDVDAVEKTWWHRLIAEKMMRLEVNNSFSGATICNMDAGHATYSFLSRMDALGHPDVIVIFGATNDDWKEAQIGDYQYDKWTAEDLTAFRPAMAQLCDYLPKQHPSAYIYFVLNSELGAEITESVQVITAHYGIPCVNLHDIQKQWKHPSTLGMEAIANQVMDAMRELR